MNPNTFIVLATFNGADFLVEQLQSLCQQTMVQWKLLIQDDGSTDGTLEAIQKFIETDDRIELVVNHERVGGSASENFSSLMAVAYERGAQYIFCCDQDDVWEPTKLAVMLAGLRQLEGEDETAALLHHDLVVVNEALVPISASLVDMMQLDPSDQQNPQRLISRNEVTGCAMVCNRALLEIALPVSGKAVMHDWWLALCAGYFGRLAFLPDKLVKYRQHDANTIGAKKFWHGLNPFTNWVEGWHRGDKEFISTVVQAGEFKKLVAARLGTGSTALETLRQYSELQSASRWQRLSVLRKYGLWRKHWLLNLVLVMRMLLLPRTAGS